MTGARTSENMSPGLLRVMERARRNPDERQFSLAYLIDVDALRRAYGRIVHVRIWRGLRLSNWPELLYWLCIMPIMF